MKIYVNRLVLIDISSFIGLLSAIYVSYGFFTKKDIYCLFFSKNSCKRVLTSKESRLFFNIPNAYIGLLVYIGIIVSISLYSTGFVPFWPVQIIVFIGFLFSCYLFYVQIFLIKSFCSWCIISAISFFVMFYAAFFLV